MYTKVSEAAGRYATWVWLSALTVAGRLSTWIGARLRTAWPQSLQSGGGGADDQHTLRACPACAALIPRRIAVCPYCQRNLPALAVRTR